MNNTKELVVICSYLPKTGKHTELLNVLQNHVPTLRTIGLATDYPCTLMTSENGTIIEIFEWKSEEASRAAHDHPEVQKIWGAMMPLADFVPLSSLAETQKPFAHFKQLKN